MDVIYHSEIGTPHTMIEVMNHIKVLLKSTASSESILFQDDECVTAMNSIPPALHINLTKHQQLKVLRPGNISEIINIEATIMSLTLRYPSLDCLQAN